MRARRTYAAIRKFNASHPLFCPDTDKTVRRITDFIYLKTCSVTSHWARELIGQVPSGRWSQLVAVKPETVGFSLKMEAQVLRLLTLIFLSHYVNFHTVVLAGNDQGPSSDHDDLKVALWHGLRLGSSSGPSLWPLIPVGLVPSGPQQPRQDLTPQDLGEESPEGYQNPVETLCITANKRQGRCMFLKDCQPLFRLPSVEPDESWLFGIHGSCPLNYKGAQVFGVCCLKDSPDTVLTVEEQSAPPEPVEDSQQLLRFADDIPGLMDRAHVQARPATDNTDDPTVRYPTNYPTFPPHPTHPPLPTHPPSHTNQPWWVTGTTTRRPSTRPSTAWPPRPSHPPTTHAPTTSQVPWWMTTTTRRPTTVTTTTTSTTPQTSTGFKDPCSASTVYSSDDDDDVYANTSQRVVNGTIARPHAFPWIVSLFNGHKQICGGSLIDTSHILTAAHCIAHMSRYDVQRLNVLLGAHNLRNRGAHTKSLRVKRVVRHKDYDSVRLYNDVAILTLEKPVEYTRYIRPICLNSGGDFVGQYATVAGWGSIYEGGPQPGDLMEVRLRVWSNEDCRQKYGSAAPGGIVPSYLCAGQGGKDSCSGDSGGPLVIKAGSVMKQVGLVSWGIGCGKGQYPGVYSRISYFLPWINRVRATY
ncbi:uncharacterized protein LOC143018498 [Oratosquilla oratoria]|uniref:uncharacterized protein LOC143018498 n=1 Tax=Oratosquilla oratoria TaxID=337810 RepID=UPI003F771354